jgi:hypothetical protein
MNCRVCAGELKEVLDLGMLYPSTFVTKTVGEKYPLVLTVCTKCGLVQLRDTIDLDSMYRKYWYKSSLNKSMVNSLQEIVNRVKEFGYPEGKVLDIGANDGTVLQLLGDQFYRVGIDPALNLKEEAEKHCDIFINDYFPSKELPDTKFDVITSIAMFYDLPDPKAFVKAIIEYLDDEGMWVIQFTDLKSMLELNAFDNICGEHLEYYSLKFLNTFFQEHNLSIFHVEHNDVNGGSLRLFVDKNFHPKHASVEYYLYDEELYFSQFEDVFFSFKERIEENKTALVNFIYNQVIIQGDLVYVLGASTKGNTLLQYYNLGYPRLKKALEVNKDKFGLKTIGSNIPIMDEAGGMRDDPDFLLVLPFHFKSFFIQKFDSYLKNGGSLLFPLPEPIVVYKGLYGNIVEEKL